MAIDKEKLQDAALQTRLRIKDKLGDVWLSLLVRGLLAVALGLAALFWPKSTLAILIMLIGIYLLIDGALNLIGAFRARAPGPYALPGFISVVAGAILLFWPDLTGRLVLIIVGLWAVFQGIMLFLAGRQVDAGDPDRNLIFTVSAVAAIAGAILVIWPGAGVVTISWLIAIAALLVGGLLISLAMRLKRVENRARNGIQN